MHEARHWHRRAYGGLGELSQMLPDEIGHAAAYEAYRSWIHNSSTYEYLRDEDERQREALIGLAIAEATRLLQFTNRPVDRFARMAASEAAAGTASTIFYQQHESGSFGGRSRSRARHNSFSGYSMSPAYGAAGSIDPYAVDDISYPRRHHSRHRSRHRSRSRHGSFPSNPMVYGDAGYPGSYGNSVYGGGGYAGSVPMQGEMYSPYGGQSSSYGQIAPYGQPQYGGYAGSHGSAMPMQPGYAGYPGSYASSAGVPVPAGSIVIQSPRRKHHRSHSRHRHRSSSRSRAPIILASAPSYAGSQRW